MPRLTGYTCDIVNGKIHTAEDYLKNCLYAFGVLFSYRDSDHGIELPDEIPLDTYHIQQVEVAKKRLEEYTARTDNEWREALKKKLEHEQESYNKTIKENQEMLDRINPIKAKIEAWNCEDKYADVKKFALEQLSMTEPDDTKWYVECIQSYEKALSDEAEFQAWKQRNIEIAQRDLDYEMQHAEEDRQRHQEFNDYLSGFKKEIAALGMTEDEHRRKVYEILDKKHGCKVNFEMNEQGNYDCFIEDCYKEGINPEYVADGIVNAEDRKKRWTSERLTVNLDDSLKAAADKIQSTH